MTTQVTLTIGRDPKALYDDSRFYRGPAESDNWKLSEPDKWDVRRKIVAVSGPILLDLKEAPLKHKFNRKERERLIGIVKSLDQSIKELQPDKKNPPTDELSRILLSRFIKQRADKIRELEGLVNKPKV